MTTADRVSNEKKNLNPVAGEFLVASRLGYSDIVGEKTRGMDRLCEAIHAGPLADPAGSPSAHRVTGSVDVLVFLLRTEHLFMLLAPVNLANLASARPSDDQHPHDAGRFPARGAAFQVPAAGGVVMVLSPCPLSE